MTDFKAIETFMWVVTLGSFRGAAQKLNTTQPAISQRIAQLEREVGVKLLQRDRRMVLPTPSGRQLMVYAEKLIGLRSEMLAVVGDRSAMRGVLRLGVAETIVHTWLTQLIKSVNHTYRSRSRWTSRRICGRDCWRRRSNSPFCSVPSLRLKSATACCASIRSAFSPARRLGWATVN